MISLAALLAVAAAWVPALARLRWLAEPTLRTTVEVPRSRNIYTATLKLQHWPSRASIGRRVGAVSERPWRRMLVAYTEIRKVSAMFPGVSLIVLRVLQGMQGPHSSHIWLVSLCRSCCRRVLKHGIRGA